MQLVNMEVNRPADNTRCHLGPLSPELNAICGPRGSGKTTLLSWLRQVTAETYGPDYAGPSWNQPTSPIYGRVEIRDAGRHFTAVQDASGRTQHHANGDAYQMHDRYGRGYRTTVQSWLTPSQRDAFAGLCSAQGVADTEGELYGLARRLGIEVADFRPENNDREQMLATRRRLSERLSELDRLTGSQQQLISRRDALENELAQLRSSRGSVDTLPADQGRWDTRWQAAQADLQANLAEITAIDAQIAQRQADLKLFETDNAVVEVSLSYREQLQKIDDRLNRWRRTLEDVRAHRESIDAGATDARLDEQVGDQLATTKIPDPRGALRALEASIVASREQLDEVVGRLGNTSYSTDAEYEVVRQPGGGETRLVAKNTHHQVNHNSELPELLRAMQKDLHDVCHQLSRQQSQATHQKMTTESQQLRRCESELLASIERLIEQRAALLGRIAAEHNLSVDRLTVAFGQWTQNPDHPNLMQWLRDEESARGSKISGASLADRGRIQEEIESLRVRRSQLELQVQNSRRQLRDSEDYRLRVVRGDGEAAPATAEQEILDSIQRITDDLTQLDERSHITQQLQEVELQLQPRRAVRDNVFADNVNRHIKAMMGPLSRTAADRAFRSHVPQQYSPGDGNESEATVEQETLEKMVPSCVVRIALRLAIGGAMSARSEPVTIILDSSLEELSAAQQSRVVSHLASVARHGQQIVMLTADERIAQDVRTHQGWVGYLQPTAIAEPEPRRGPDVNRSLAALANEEEADKWYSKVAVPEVTRSVDRGDYYLSRSCSISELPSIQDTAIASLRESGVECVGDLLDADTDWLADRIGVRESTMMRWQSEANLLCSVKKLRPFDARVMVGAGIRSAAQLASIHPGKLLARVEEFFATEQGQNILSSGSSYELSRITAWIASAKSGASSRGDSSARSSGSRNTSSRSSSSGLSERDYSRERSSSSRSSSSESRSKESRRSGRSQRSSRSRQGESERLGVVGRNGSSRRSRDYNEQSTQNESTETLKFYLDLTNPVVDAPTIGPRMATRLEKLEIITVQDLLAADADWVAEQLDLRRVDSAEVQSWQLQSQLVCRIPNLRGHDAQMLVACEIRSPEELRNMDAESVLQQVLTFVKTGDGARVLRGGKEPDLEEVNDWIAWSGSSRQLNAA